MKELNIYGCGGHARSVADAAIFNNYSNIKFIDAGARLNETIFGFPVLEKIDHNGPYIVAIGDNQKRQFAFDQLNAEHAISLVTKDAYLGQDAAIGRGAFIAHFAYVGPNAKVGNNTIINTRAIVEHDCVVGDHSHVSIGSAMAGKAKLGDRVFLGAGAIVIDGISVCSDVIIGAGSVVVADIHEPGTYVGIPAKRIK